MAKRTINHRRQEESDSSSSDDSREKRMRKRQRKNKKSFIKCASHDSIAIRKPLIGENKTSTPRNMDQNFQNYESECSETEYTSKQSKLRTDDTLNEQLTLHHSDEISRSNGENGLTDCGFASFMKRFDFFSEDEENLNGDLLRDQNQADFEDEDEVDDTSDENDSVNHIADVSVMSCDLLTADNVKNVANNYRKLTYHSKNAEVLFLKHPISIPIVGYLNVTLLAGRASILGYHLIEGKTIQVFSQKKTGILTVDTLPHDKLNKKALKRVKHHLKKILYEELMPEVRRNCREVRGILSTVVLLEEHVLPPALEFVEYYLPEAFSGIKSNFHSRSFTPVLYDSTHVIDLSEKYEELFAKVEQHVSKKSKKKSLINTVSSDTETSSEDEDTVDKMDVQEIQNDVPETMSGFEANESVSSEDINPFIFISGPKRCGKSTMLRYLLNKFLNSYEDIFYLDTDAGQSEFTPPGTVSLTKVTEPVFGPPFTHLRQPEKMVFIGSVTSETSPTMYGKTITYLINYFLKKFPGKILLINTMGWITGVGDMTLQHIKKTANPSVEIELQAERLPLEFRKLNNKILKCKAGFHIDSAVATKKGQFLPSLYRNCALLAYFGRIQKTYLPLTPINGFPTHEVCWDNIFLYHFDKRLDAHRLFEAVNCSVVGLCKVDESLQLLSASEEYPNSLMDEPLNNCLGYGLVRTVDETNHILYIVTPLSVDTLCHVNSVIGGNIIIPEAVLLKQPLYNKELYYTDESVGGPTEGRKPIQRRARMNTTLLH